MLISFCKYLNCLIDFDRNIQEAKHVERYFAIIGHVVRLLKIKTFEKPY